MEYRLISILENNTRLQVSMKRSDLLITFFGVLDRGIYETYPVLNRFVERMRSEYTVTVACFDIRRSRVDEVARCFDASRLLACDEYVGRNESQIRRALSKVKPITFSRSYYTAKMNANAMAQLYSEQMVADHLFKHARSYDYVVACSSDLFFMDELDPRRLRALKTNEVMTSNQQNGANGYTNGFYIGSPLAVAKIMSRLRDINALTRVVHDYEYMLRCAFELNNVSHVSLTPWYFLKIRADCRAVWPVTYMKRVGRVPSVFKYYTKMRKKQKSLIGRTNCTCKTE